VPRDQTDTAILEISLIVMWRISRQRLAVRVKKQWEKNVAWRETQRRPAA
jgi:hypothetical protein